MTLLVACVEGPLVWMVADTVITDPAAGPRARARFCPKIEPVGAKGLVGFAGNDAHNAARIARDVAGLQPGPVVLASLLAGHRAYPAADFAHAYLDEAGRPRLFRVADGRAEELTTFHLGSHEAFSAFQSIRNSVDIDHAPDAIHLLLDGFRNEKDAPHQLHVAIKSMITLFASRAERDVGGWPVPYLLGPWGVELCSYAYSVTDPILGRLPPGSTIPHGTAEAGGFGLSVAELRERDGMVVYWQQRPGGLVLVRSEGGYDEHAFAGAPSIFKENVRAALGRDVDLWFGDLPLGPPVALRYLRDEKGRPRIAVAEDATGALSMAWVQNTTDPFQIREGSPTVRHGGERNDNDVDSPQFHAELTESGAAAALEMRLPGEPPRRVTLDAAGLDHLLGALASLRARMSPEVSLEIAPGTPLAAVVDPAWRTRAAAHPAIPGPLLALRHPGFGWVPFVLPYGEAASLGRWLSEHAAEGASMSSALGPGPEGSGGSRNGPAGCRVPVPGKVEGGS